MVLVPPDANWRDSARSIKFFIWDGKVMFPLIIFFVHIRWWTLILAVGAIIFFTILNRFGFTPIVFYRWFRSKLAGKRKISMPWWLQ